MNWKEFVVECLPYIPPFISFCAIIVSVVVGVIKGKQNKAKNAIATQLEQENDLYNFMIKEVNEVQAFSSFLKLSMTKEALSDYKHTSVMKSVKAYAMASGYKWYDELVWNEKLTEYIANTKLAQK